MRVEKNWGREEILHNGSYCAKLLIYTREISSSLHYHERKHETFVVIDGVFYVDVDGQERRMTSGSSVVIPPGVPHRIRCVEVGTICESSSHDDPSDCVRLVPSES